MPETPHKDYTNEAKLFLAPFSTMHACSWGSLLKIHNLTGYFLTVFCSSLIDSVEIHTGVIQGGTHGVMVIIIENENGDLSSNPKQDYLNFM